MSHRDDLVVVVHGGAGYIADEFVGVAKAGVSDAAQVGYAVLLAGGSALDAVEAAVRRLEDLPFFNAGYGSVLNRDGLVEMDALIADGLTLNLGAVTMVRSVSNPISLARKVMELTPHVLLGGKGAEDLAALAGIPTVDNSLLVTDARRVQLDRALALAAGSPASPGIVKPIVLADVHKHTAQVDGSPADAGDHDTVGAVAIDFHGNVAAATSTGGLTGKWAGRIGDTPVFGAGGYADNACGAVSTTGTGEFIIRSLLAKSACDAYAALRDLAAPQRASAAAAQALRRMHERMPAPGAGLIFVSPERCVGVAHTTARMSWAACRGTTTADAQLDCSVTIPTHGVMTGQDGKEVHVHCLEGGPEYALLDSEAK